MDQDQKLQCAIDLVRTMMSSASSDHIRRIEWWSRAKIALETAAARADNFGSMVSVMARKLQIDVTTIATGERVAELATRIDDFAVFSKFCATDALYVVAIAQAESKQRRGERERSQGDIVDHYGAPNLQPEDKD